MARQSSIDRLPREIRDLIRDLRQGGRTIDEILDKLAELHVDVSRSALGRHTQEIDQLTETLRASRGIAETVMERLEDSDDAGVARLNVELMHSMVTKAMLSQDGTVATFEPRELMFLSSTLQKLSAAAKTDQDREIRLRRELQAKVAAAVDRVAEEDGDATADDSPTARAALLRRVREEVYGIIGG